MASRYSSMSDEELRELAKGKNKQTGCLKKQLSQHSRSFGNEIIGYLMEGCTMMATQTEA